MTNKQPLNHFQLRIFSLTYINKEPHNLVKRSRNRALGKTLQHTQSLTHTTPTFHYQTLKLATTLASIVAQHHQCIIKTNVQQYCHKIINMKHSTMLFNSILHCNNNPHPTNCHTLQRKQLQDAWGIQKILHLATGRTIPI